MVFSTSLEMPLPRIEGNAERVIEMRVGDEDVRDADERVGTPADVERDVQLAHAQIRLMTGARTAVDREVLRLDREVVFVGHAMANARTGNVPIPFSRAGTAKNRNRSGGN